jgi:hypothetical protein
MGPYGISDEESERQFKDGMRAIMDAIGEHGVLFGGRADVRLTCRGRKEETAHLAK